MRIQDSEIIHYERADDTTTGSACTNFPPTHSFFRDCFVAWRVLRAGHSPDLGDDRILAPQLRTDTPSSKHTKPSHICRESQILKAVGSKIRLVNTSNEPNAIGRHEHLSQIVLTTGAPSPTPSRIPTDQPSPVRPKCSPLFLSAVPVDSDNLLPDQSRLKFQQLLQEYDRVIDNWL